MTSLPIDNMPAAELAVHLMTSGFSLSGGEPEARRLLAELRTQWAAEDTAPAVLARVQDAADTVAALRAQPDRIADSEILRAAPDDSDDWSDEVWAAWHRVAERAHAARPPLKSRLALLLAHVQEHGGEWTTRRVQKLYAAAEQSAPLRTTARKDLHALHAMGWLVLDTTDPGRRCYRLNHAHTEARHG
ncbi:hypothetical protein OG402_11820 [Streptomyces anulatus]|uniref:hypothetical protein n=1 Tax=Streptomyces anulatus TaxID=1892 RepID=UPI00224F38CB|nr:hypothetical protein [Streptomyces anulatus]MCX4601175.1 hypothetical protein [Streptomyces anulatus]